MEEFDLVVTPGGCKVPKAALRIEENTNNWFGTNGTSCLRQGWEQAKREGRLTGCGLMGRLTMDDIEELKDRVEKAMTEWARLAGNIKFRTVAENPLAREQELNNQVSDLTDKLALMEIELKSLRKTVDNQKAKEVKVEKSALDKLTEDDKSVIDKITESTKDWVELTR